MGQQLNLARAAQLVGVPRSTLQRMIGAGELTAFDGLISVDELRRAFPSAQFDEGGALERVRWIREEAFGRRLRERALPSQEVLAQRLFAQGEELADLRRFVRGYHELLVAAGERAAEMATGDPRLLGLAEYLRQGLKQVLSSEPASKLDVMANMMQVISAQVTVRPSGRQFLVEGNDSILQAGLKAGLRFSYGCGSGTCGLCKARVVAGSVQQVGHGDYRLSEQERQQGYVLMCTHTAVSDVIVESLEAGGPADIPQQELVATVRAITPLGADTLLLHLQTPRSNRLRFLAGQAVSLGVADPGGDLAQTVALASCPCDERNLHFHVARDGSAPLASALFAGRLRSGDAIGVRGPVGDFVIDAESDRPLLFVACDTGFGPVKSLIEHAMASEQAESFALHWLATRADGHYLDNQCRAWAAAYDQFTYQPYRDDDAAAGASRLVERIGADGPAPAGCDAFVAGPAAFVDAAAAALGALGVPPGRLRALAI